MVSMFSFLNWWDFFVTPNPNGYVLAGGRRYAVGNISNIVYPKFFGLVKRKTEIVRLKSVDDPAFPPGDSKALAFFTPAGILR
jgi:hypothetical protein